MINTVRYSLLTSGILLSSMALAAPAGDLPLMPWPAHVERPQAQGALALNNQLTINVSGDDLGEAANRWRERVARQTGWTLQPQTAPAKSPTINVIVNKKVPFLPQPDSDESYQLTVNAEGATLKANTRFGALRGMETLLQLVQNGPDGTTIPYVAIDDAPRFPWRGLLLDSARHFMPLSAIKRQIDGMAAAKLNVLHWHLTDDQGWRIEIKKYPLLTQIGSRRAETLVGRYDKNKEGVYDGKPYGGFYTQEEIREIVSYAAERHIEVIPEIEMPGHGLAALTAYPWLGCTGGPYAVWTHWGISDDVYCAGKETTFEFIEKVLTEVLALFPSKLIHIGGDECPKGRWKACPLCQQRIREEGLKDEYQLQSYFIHRIERWMHTHGREIIGWDEILQGGISKTANIMSWNGSDPGIKAAQRGNPVIMTPKWYCYFDYSQTSDPERYEPLGNTRYVSVRQAYRLDPCDRLTLPDQKRIRGVQCNLWTEYIADIRHAQHMVLPRMAALAETGWANDRKDYNDFVRRIPALVAVYKAEGYNYAPYLFEGIE